MPNLPRLAAWLRKWADRIDDDGAIKSVPTSFTLETGEGMRIREDGKGCPLWFIQSDYERAHTEADSNQPDPDMDEAARFLAEWEKKNRE